MRARSSHSGGGLTAAEIYPVKLHVLSDCDTAHAERIDAPLVETLMVEQVAFGHWPNEVLVKHMQHIACFPCPEHVGATIRVGRPLPGNAAA